LRNLPNLIHLVFSAYLLVTIDGTQYVSPVDAKIREDFDVDADANDGEYTIKFFGGRSD
jgi:hypothetical protein